MKKVFYVLCIIIIGISISTCIDNAAKTSTATEPATQASDSKGQSSVQDVASAKNVVQIAAVSKEHITLVGAVQSVDFVNSF